MPKSRPLDQKFSPDVLALISQKAWLQALSEEFQQGVNVAMKTALIINSFIETQAEQNIKIMTEALKQLVEIFSPYFPPIDPESGRQQAEEAMRKILTSYNEALTNKKLDFETDPGGAPIALYVRQAALVRAWASLEALSEDLWTGSINTAGRKFRQQAFERATMSASDASGISRKHIEVSVLAKHDFNLQGKLGSLLADKFSFKTAEGITAAYDAAFGWVPGRPPPNFTDLRHLKGIEAKRHVIVHRGGIIDQEYITKTGSNPILLGFPLSLDQDACTDDIRAILDEGVQLLSVTATWLNDVNEP